MDNILSIFILRFRTLKNRFRGVKYHSRLKIVVVWLMVIGLFAGAFYAPYRAFLFLQSLGSIGLVIIDRLLYLFFFGLFMMLVFSNSIICFSTNYRAEETAFFFTLPLKHSAIFFVKFIDSMIMSSWAFVCFLVPIMAAYACVRQLDWFFYFALVVFFIPFAVVAGGLGSLATVLLVRFVPRWCYRFLGYFFSIVFLLGFFWLVIEGKQANNSKSEITFLLTNLIPHFAIAQSPFMPNYWISEGLFKVIAADFKDSLFWWLLLTSNALFLGLIALTSARKWYYQGWTSLNFLGEAKKYFSGKSLSERVFKKLKFIHPALRALMVKDIKTFWRDPVQWSQFTIFFGLLAIYFANIRSLGYETVLPFWKNVISFLNLASTNLTLASLSVRFVYPQFSLEGKRFWILGLAPVKKSSLLLEKFCLNGISALIISMPLITVSNLMLRVSAQIMFLSSFMVFFMCLSQVALSVGLGVLFPNFKEDNPAQIVSGFGGTLALVLSLVYICLCVGALAFPFHLLVTGQINQIFFDKLLLAVGFFVFVLSAATIILPLYLANRILEKMEM